MKKTAIFLLIIVLALGLAACGDKPIEQKGANAETPKVAEAQPAENAEPEHEATPVPTMVTAATDTDLVKTAKIRLPDVARDVLGKVEAGTEMTLVTRGTEWHEVVVNGKQGFVFAADIAGVDPAPSPYYIYIEKGSHTINVFAKDDNGEYTVLAKQFLTATGLTAGKTPTGVFAIGKKYTWKQFDSAGTKRQYSYSPYVTEFTDGIYIHGSVYADTNFNTMFGNTYKEIGTNATAGCMRTNAGAAYWIFANCPLGTPVEVVNGSPRDMETPELLEYIHLDEGGYIDPTDPNHSDHQDYVNFND